MTLAKKEGNLILLIILILMWGYHTEPPIRVRPIKGLVTPHPPSKFVQNSLIG